MALDTRFLKNLSEYVTQHVPGCHVLYAQIEGCYVFKHADYLGNLIIYKWREEDSMETLGNIIRALALRPVTFYPHNYAHDPDEPLLTLLPPVNEY